MASSLPLDTVMSCPRLEPRSAVESSPKPLAFSIDRIMSKTTEERRGPDNTEGKRATGLCAPMPCMIPIQPLAYDLQAKALVNYSEFWRANFRGALCASAAAAATCKSSCGACTKTDLLPGSRVIKPQVIHQAMTMPGNASLYYFNYLDAAYHQSELLSGHLFSSVVANSQAQAMTAHQKLLLLESAKLSEKVPTPQYPHKERLPGQLDHLMKENHGLGSEKNIAKVHSKANTCPADGKPKNFTCEVCGKVNYWKNIAMQFVILIFLSHGEDMH